MPTWKYWDEINRIAVDLEQVGHDLEEIRQEDVVLKQMIRDADERGIAWRAREDSENKRIAPPPDTSWITTEWIGPSLRKTKPSTEASPQSTQQHWDRYRPGTQYPSVKPTLPVGLLLLSAPGTAVFLYGVLFLHIYTVSTAFLVVLWSLVWLYAGKEIRDLIRWHLERRKYR